MPPAASEAPGAPQTTTVGAIESFGVAADTAIEACEVRRAAVVSIVDAHNALVSQAAARIAPPSWWPFR